MRNELIIGGLQVDVADDISMNLTKEVYSIIDPSKRKSDYSKTVEIPGSKKNDNVFASLFDVNFTIRNTDQLNPDFNPSKKASCVFVQDSFQQMKGYCQLTKVTVLENNKVVYSIVMYGQVRDLFSDISNLTLNDLTTLGTADWTDANIIASWTDTFDPVIKPVYPYVNRGKAIFNRVPGAAPPEWSYGADAFKPWMYVKHLVNAIISEAGYSTEIASFFNTEQFNKLIMECDIKKFQKDDTARAQSSVDANKTNQETINTASGALSNFWSKQIKYNNEVTDPSGQYDPATGTFTYLGTGPTYINFGVQIDGRISNGLAGTINTEFLVMRKRGSAYSVIKVLPINNLILNISGDGDINRQYFEVDSAYIEPNDQVRVVFGTTTLGGVLQTPSFTNFSAGSFNFFTSMIDGQIEYGQTFDIATVLPNMKQTDFLMGIFKWCNAYIDTVPNEGLIIEPRDLYFTDEVVDWTSKLDVSRDFNIVPQGLLENKEILFGYSANDDDLSANFKQSVGYDYGYKRLIFDNDFVRDKRELKLPFSLCPLKKDTDFGNVNMITIFDGQAAEKSTNPILAYFGGMKTGRMVYWEQPAVPGGPQTRVEYAQYPFAGPVDDVTAPNYDLAFGLQDIYYYTTPGVTGLNLTTNNSYKQFHETQWQEIGHRDSKLVEAYIKLNADDIAALSFRPSYWIRDAYYRLLGVYDYNPDGKATTLCKFLKLNTFTPDADTVVTRPGGNGQGGDTTRQGDLFRQTRDGRSIAWGNNISDNTTGVHVLGYGNTVGEGSTNMVVHGNNNTIMGNVQNVFLIDTDDMVITESNQIYISGIKVEVGIPTDGYVWTFNAADNKIEFQPSGSGPGAVNWGDIAGTLSDQADLQTALDDTLDAAEAYADSLVVGLWDDRGGYNPTITSDYPITGGSGPGDTILKGDIWTISMAGIMSGTIVSIGDTVRALIDSPGLTDSNWDIQPVGLGYVPENSANKDTDGTLAANSDIKYPSQKAVKTYADTKVTANAGITGATKTKITYDSKGLITAGADATTADIADSSNKRYVTDAQLVVIGNTSGTNSGNETTTTIGNLINGATSKTPPVDADYIPLMDSAASNIMKKLSWANLKATIASFLGWQSNADGGQITSGTTARILKWLGADITLTGSGTATLTFPSVSDTIVGNKSDPAAKCWAKVQGDGSAILASFNITSITDNGTGDVTITIATDFSSANWSCNATVERVSTALTVANIRGVTIRNAGQAAGTIRLECFDDTATTHLVKDPQNYHFVGFGAQ